MESKVNHISKTRTKVLHSNSCNLKKKHDLKLDQRQIQDIQDIFPNIN